MVGKGKEGGAAAAEGPLSGKEWRGRKMGAKEELEWRRQCVGEGRREGYREKKEEGRGGGGEDERIDGERESIDRRERGG